MFKNYPLNKKYFLEALPKVKSKKVVLQLAALVTNSGEAQYLLSLLSEKEFAAKAAWVFSHACDQNPQLFEPLASQMLDLLEINQDKASARALLRSLTLLNLDENNIARAKELAKAYIEDPNQAIAAKAFSLRLLQKYIPKNSQEQKEVYQLLKPLLHNASPGILSAAKWFAP